MPFIIEIKARSGVHDRIRTLLRERGARFVGEDHQIDTYFHVPHGRLKLREGTIENTLIHYHRPDQAGPKPSDVLLYEPAASASLKALLTRALGVLVVVDKRREIYFIDHVKFHLDRVEGLGTFVEIEAIDTDGTIGEETLRAQCSRYLRLFEMDEANLVRGSYSDLVLRHNAE